MRRALIAFALIGALCASAPAQECAQIDTMVLVEKLRARGVIVLEGARLETFLVELSEALQTPFKGVLASAFDGHLLLFVVPDSFACIGEPTDAAKPIVLKHLGGRGV